MISTAVSAAILAALLTLPASGSVVFSNITAPIASGFSYGTPAGLEFTVSGGDFQLTDVQATVWNQNSSTVTVDFSIYSDSSGPDTLLTTLTGTLPADSNETITSGAPSTSLVLENGMSYWLVLDLSNYAWDGNGSSSAPLAEYSSGSWFVEPSIPLQFQIDGTLATPEPASVAITAMGIGLLALRRKLR